jgi:phasin family protein
MIKGSAYMADESVKAEEAGAAEKVETAAVEAPAKAEPEAKAETVKTETKPQAEAKSAPAAVPAKAPKARRLARKAKAARPVTKAKTAATPAKAKKTKPVRKPAMKRKTKPVRAGATRTQGAVTMTTKKNGIDAGLFAAEQFKTVFGDVNERAKAATERSAKIVEELADLTRGNVEALVASSKIAAKGVETLSQDAAEYSRKSFEEASATFKSFAEVKSATDLFKLQGDFARAAFDNAVAESARVSEALVKLAGDIAEPLNSRYSVAAERVKTLAA